MKADWTEILKQKLEEHKQTPPTGLWEGISEQMGLQAETVRRTALVRHRWRWAAAAVVLLIGFLALHDWNKDKQVKSATAPVEHMKHIMPPTDEVVSPTEKTSTEMLAQIEGKFKNTSVNKSVTTDVKDPKVATDTLLLHQGENVGEQDYVLLANDEVPTREQQSTSSRRQQADHLTDNLITQTSSSKNLRSQRWSLGVEASGGLLAAQTFRREGRLYYANAYQYYGAPGTIDGGTRPIPYTLTEYVAKHYLPVRFGVGLQYQLTSRWALLTGVNYTYLYSRFSAPLYENLVTDQRLHYLGIPLGVNCQLWSNRHFQVYVSGHVMLEKCLNESPWQWSTFAAVGTEYLATRQLGLYLQPSLGYYFKDGTSLQHYYKKHPLTPSVEVGARLHLGK
ncbi:MAG: hypothetical protein IJK45_05555 [Bacteroidaceae bacterium]|nr:hypothetical protein [Bacteroidaceae bacterium]